MGARLEALAKQRKIRVVSFGPSNGFFYRGRWLRRIDAFDPVEVEVFESR